MDGLAGIHPNLLATGRFRFSEDRLGPVAPISEPTPPVATSRSMAAWSTFRPPAQERRASEARKVVIF